MIRVPRLEFSRSAKPTRSARLKAVLAALAALAILTLASAGFAQYKISATFTPRAAAPNGPANNQAQVAINAGVDAFRWGTETFALPQGATAKPAIVKRHVDAKSQAFASAHANKQVYEQVVLEWVRASDGQPIYRVTLSDVVISAYLKSQPSGDEGPEEKITFVYGTLRVQYRQQQKDGTLTGWADVDPKQGPPGTNTPPETTPPNKKKKP